MTLEQIKQQQLGLNEFLQLHLTDLEVVIAKIAGVQREQVLKEEPKEESNGLLEEINSAQKELERKIDKLNSLKQRLYYSTFEQKDKAV